MTLKEIADKRAEIEARDAADLKAFRAGRLTELEAQERGTLRQYERRWLDLEEKLARGTLTPNPSPARRGK